MEYKMSRQERAKQFMPFAALKGYPEALQRKEKPRIPKRELPEEFQTSLDWKLRQVRKNDRVIVTYYHESEYLELTGRISELDRTTGTLGVDDVRIPFEDLYDIERIRMDHLPFA